MKRTNIEDKLRKVRQRNKSSSDILEQVQEILREDNAHKGRIAKNLQGGRAFPENTFDFDQLETDRIYHIADIRKICIDYRLRFLDSKYFKGEIPPTAIQEIKRLEKKHGTEISGYRIVAPSKLFKLADKDDPLLFAPIGNGYFYLIHKWGNDLHPLRKIMAWPFKNIANLTGLIILISYLTTLLVPNGLFSKQGGAAEFWIIFFFMFKSIAAVVIFYGFALGKNFNPAIWNSRYFNA